MQTGFTHRINGEPIPPKQAPYVANFAEPCKTGKRAAKVTAFVKGGIDVPPKEDADRRASFSKAAI